METMMKKIKKWWEVTFRKGPVYVYVVSNTYNGKLEMLAFLEREEATQYMWDLQYGSIKPMADGGSLYMDEIELL
jgi:hypothetical protein